MSVGSRGQSRPRSCGIKEATGKKGRSSACAPRSGLRSAPPREDGRCLAPRPPGRCFPPPSPCAPRRGGNSCARRRRPRKSRRPERGRAWGSRRAPRRGRPLAHGAPRPLPGLPRAASDRPAPACSSSIFIRCPVGASSCQPALQGIPRQPTSPSKPPFARVPGVLCHPGCKLVGLLLGLGRNSLS